CTTASGRSCSRCAEGVEVVGMRDYGHRSMIVQSSTTASMNDMTVTFRRNGNRSCPHQHNALQACGSRTHQPNHAPRNQLSEPDPVSVLLRPSCLSCKNTVNSNVVKSRQANA